MIPKPSNHDPLNLEGVQFEELGRAPVGSEQSQSVPVQLDGPQCGPRCPTEHREVFRNTFPAD